MTREPSPGELAEDIHALRAHVDGQFRDMAAQMTRLADRIDTAPYVRQDTHQAQLEGIRQGLDHVRSNVNDVKTTVGNVDASVARLQQLVIGAFGTIIVAGITAIVTGAASP